MRRQTDIRNAIESAYDLSNRMQCAIQHVVSLLIYRNFNDDDEPVPSITSSGEFILEWHGSEMTIENALYLMENYGYIDSFMFY